MTPLLTGVFASQISGHLTPPFTSTGSYDALATYTVGAGGISNISFSGIPDGYSHLQIRYFIPSTPSAGDNIYMRLGSGSIDTGSNYAWHNIVGYGSNITAASTESSVTFMRLLYQNITEAAAYPVSGITDILDYGSTSKKKVIRTLIGRDANSATSAWSVASFMSGLWNSTAPVTTFNITYGGGNLPQNTRVSVYGVK